MPTEICAELHNRMPVVLAPGAWPAWLGEQPVDLPELMAMAETPPLTRARRARLLGTGRPPHAPGMAGSRCAGCARPAPSIPPPARSSSSRGGRRSLAPRSRPGGTDGRRPRRSSISSACRSTHGRLSVVACRRPRSLPAGGANAGRPRCRHGRSEGRDAAGRPRGDRAISAGDPGRDGAGIGRPVRGSPADRLGVVGRKLDHRQSVPPADEIGHGAHSGTPVIGCCPRRPALRHSFRERPQKVGRLAGLSRSGEDRLVVGN